MSSSLLFTTLRAGGHNLKSMCKESTFPQQIKVPAVANVTKMNPLRGTKKSYVRSKPAINGEFDLIST